LADVAVKSGGGGDLVGGGAVAADMGRALPLGGNDASISCTMPSQLIWCTHQQCTGL